MSSRTPNVNFCIKLLAGKNVVLVEAPGYESEIFVPIIRGGRIGFTNIVPSRGCKTAAPRCDNSRVHQPTGLESYTPVRPRACSTPNASAKVKALGKENIRNGHLNLESPHFTARTPEQVRFAKVATPNDTIRAATDILFTPRKRRSRKSIAAKSRLRSSVSVPPSSPSKSTRMTAGTINKDGSHVAASPLQLPPTPRLNAPQNRRLHKLKVSNRPDVGSSPSNWRKCITPIRTYSRQVIAATLKSRSNTIPTCLAEPTKGPRLSNKVETRERKFIVDRKCIISPRSFKKQMKSSPSTKADSRAQLPRTSKEYELAKAAAFDMLTNPARPHMHGKLKKMFRKKCINKASSTVPKYKLLATLSKEDTIDRALKARKKLQLQRAATLCNPTLRKVRAVGSGGPRL